MQPVPALLLIKKWQEQWPDKRVIYPELTINLRLSLQVNSAEFIHCKELVDQELMCLQPPNAVYIFYPISQTVQGHPKARLPFHHPSEWKSSHQGRLRVAVSQPVPAPFTPTTAQIPGSWGWRMVWWIQTPAQWWQGSKCWEDEHRRILPSTELPLPSLTATQKGLVENYCLGSSTCRTSRSQQTEQPKQQGKSVTVLLRG